MPAPARKLLSWDPVSKQPIFKVTAVRLERVGEA
jgi:hypothetical protein